MRAEASTFTIRDARLLFLVFSGWRWRCRRGFRATRVKLDEPAKIDDAAIGSLHGKIDPVGPALQVGPLFGGERFGGNDK
jgi:hypothetical protein